MDCIVGINYIVEYCFISKLIDNTECRDFPDIRVLDKPIDLEFAFSVEESTDDDDTFDWVNLSITKFKSKELTYWLLKFPPCRGPIDAVYGLVVKYKRKRVVYFTLESSPSGRYVLGMPYIVGHRSIETVDELPTEEEFKNWALRKLEERPELFETLKSYMDSMLKDCSMITFK